MVDALGAVWTEASGRLQGVKLGWFVARRAQYGRAEKWTVHFGQLRRLSPRPGILTSVPELPDHRNPSSRNLYDVLPAPSIGRRRHPITGAIPVKLKETAPIKHDILKWTTGIHNSRTPVSYWRRSGISSFPTRDGPQWYRNLIFLCSVILLLRRGPFTRRWSELCIQSPSQWDFPYGIASLNVNVDCKTRQL